MNAHPFTRRRFLKTSGLAASAAIFNIGGRALSAPAAKVLETKVISLDPENYHGWATLARRKNGQLVVTCSGGRESHVCPFGRVDMIVSNDHGATWSFPRTVLDSDTDDRDSGVLETARGTLLVTTFTSLAYEPSLAAAEKKNAGDPGAWPPERLARWQAARDRLTPEQRKAELGQWIIRSTDGGLTWSVRLPSIVNSPHGPIQLRDGRLLYAGKELWTATQRNGVCESLDDGLTWRWLAEIPTRAGDQAKEYHELHATETRGGRILAQLAKQLHEAKAKNGGKPVRGLISICAAGGQGVAAILEA